ncbi:MAG: hypothetical protein MN733_03965 [Nitrososphaera sp.]|nr:hypothetical protein [Nitrososphaera sp.]
MSLPRAARPRSGGILNAGEIKPHRIEYYLGRRAAQFEEKMREVLMIYQEVVLANAARAFSRTPVRSSASAWTRNPAFRRLALGLRPTSFYRN